MLAPDEIEPVPSCVQKIVPFAALAPDTVASLPGQIVVLPPALAVGKGSIITVYVAVAVNGTHSLLLVTVMVNVTVVPASPGAGVYTGVRVDPPDVIEPAPFSVHAIVPFVAVAPLTVAVSFTHIVCKPPALAVGKGSTFTV